MFNIRHYPVEIHSFILAKGEQLLLRILLQRPPYDVDRFGDGGRIAEFGIVHVTGEDVVVHLFEIQTVILVQFKNALQLIGPLVRHDVFRKIEHMRIDPADFHLHERGVLEPLKQIRFIPVEPFGNGVAQRMQNESDQRFIQLLLAAKIMEQQPFGDAGFINDVIGGRFLVRGVGKLFDRRVDDAIPFFRDRCYL